MKVCDTHTDRKAVDTVHVVSQDTHSDVCAECRDKVLAVLSAQFNAPPKDEPAKKKRWFAKDSAPAG